jgi:hypothetical protein
VDGGHALLLQLEEAKLLWAQGQRAMAVRMAKGLAAAPGRDVSAEMRARLLCLAGKWLTQSRCPRPPQTHTCVLRERGAPCLSLRAAG